MSTEIFSQHLNSSYMGGVNDCSEPKGPKIVSVALLAVVGHLLAVKRFVANTESFFSRLEVNYIGVLFHKSICFYSTVALIYIPHTQRRFKGLNIIF